MKDKQPRLFPISRLSSRQFLHQKYFWRKLEKTPALSINKLLNSCIQVEEARISRRSTIPCQVNFKLNSDILYRLEQIRLNKQQFILSPINLTNLRYYVLLNYSLKDTLSPIYSFQSDLTFSTSYLYPDKEEFVTLVRSEINLSGKISQQIKQDWEQETQFYNRILDAHYWLIAQIIAQLPLKSNYHKSWLFYSFWLSIEIIIVLIICYFLPFNFLSTILLNLSIIIILNLCLKYIIKKYIKLWLLDNLNHGWLSNNYRKRKIGFKLLSLMISLNKQKIVLTEILR